MLFRLTNISQEPLPLVSSRVLMPGCHVDVEFKSLEACLRVPQVKTAYALSKIRLEKIQDALDPPTESSAKSSQEVSTESAETSEELAETPKESESASGKKKKTKSRRGRKP